MDEERRGGSWERLRGAGVCGEHALTSDADRRIDAIAWNCLAATRLLLRYAVELATSSCTERPMIRLLLPLALTLALALPATRRPRRTSCCSSPTTSACRSAATATRSRRRRTSTRLAEVGHALHARLRQRRVVQPEPGHDAHRHADAHVRAVRPRPRRRTTPHSFRSVKGLPALLAPAGYRSGVIAKLHVQPKEVYPFDVEVAGNGRNPVASRGRRPRSSSPTRGDKPFFLLVGFTDPHRAAKGFANDGKYPADVPAVKFDPKTVPVPYHLPDQPEVRAELAEYYQSVARLDHGVGLRAEGARRREEARRHAGHLPERQRHPVPRREDDALRRRRAPAADRPQAGAEGRRRERRDGRAGPTSRRRFSTGAA